LKNTRASSVPVHGTSLSMHELPSSCKDPNDKAWFERRGYELRKSNMRPWSRFEVSGLHIHTSSHVSKRTISNRTIS
jgi:hypothetical protein